MGTLVVCLSCRRVVWACDNTEVDVRGVLNHIRLPCRLCGAQGNFDGWRVTPEGSRYFDAPDSWQAMHRWADMHGFAWAASGDCAWEIPVEVGP